uniref:Palmitoyl-protein thioesterase 1 n=1 Tax=Aceria tosichella TaxID=561515 RepID=A0A6G1SCG6_9ACAR
MVKSAGSTLGLYLIVLVVILGTLAPASCAKKPFTLKSPTDKDFVKEPGREAQLILLDDDYNNLNIIDHNAQSVGQQKLRFDMLSASAAATNYTPVVFWHGMGDTAYGSINIDRLALQKKFPGMKVFSIQIGNTVLEDEMAGYFVNVNQQVDSACKAILGNELIRASGRMNAIGFSQGAQFLRALVQRCPLREHGIQVKNLISLGGQHQGVYGLPNCYTTVWCDYIRHMLSTGAYEEVVQEHSVQAEYWHDPWNESEYRAKNVFLPDVNNENTLNTTYKNNLLALENFVLVKFAQDDMVVPRDSSLFAFYEPGQNVVIKPLEESAIWLEDRLGLRQLNDSGRLKRITIPGRHLQYRMSWFLNEIGAKYLAN